MSETYGGQPPSEQPPPSQPPPSGQWPSQPPPAPVAPSPRRHDEKPKTGWFVGVVLIVLGVVFLLEQFGWVFPGNWWAIFIYLGAAATFVNMWRQWRAAGWFDSKAAGSLTFGLVLIAVATIAYFDAWDTYWPLILVAIGVGIVAGWLLGASTERQRN